MIRVRWENPASFQERAWSFLIAREVENNLMFRLLEMAQAGRFSGYHLVTAEEDEVIAAGILVPPSPLVLAAGSERAAAALAHAFSARGISAPAVQAVGPAAREFADRMAERTGGATRPDIMHVIYVLDRSPSFGSAPGSDRSAAHADQALIEEWLEAFWKDVALPPLPNREAFVRAALDAEDVWLWQTPEGAPASMAWRTGHTPRGSRIGMVYTPRMQRRRGYGRAVTAALAQTLFRAGCTY